MKTEDKMILQCLLSGCVGSDFKDVYKVCNHKNSKPWMLSCAFPRGKFFKQHDH